MLTVLRVLLVSDACEDEWFWQLTNVLILNYFHLRQNNGNISLIKRGLGRVRWLMPVIPALWEAKVGGS